MANVALTKHKCNRKSTCIEVTFRESLARASCDSGTQINVSHENEDPEHFNNTPIIRPPFDYTYLAMLQKLCICVLETRAAKSEEHKHFIWLLIEVGRLFLQPDYHRYLTNGETCYLEGSTERLEMVVNLVAEIEAVKKNEDMKNALMTIAENSINKTLMSLVNLSEISRAFGKDIIIFYDDAKILLERLQQKGIIAEQEVAAASNFVLNSEGKEVSLLSMADFISRDTVTLQDGIVLTRNSMRNFGSLEWKLKYWKAMAKKGPLDRTEAEASEDAYTYSTEDMFTQVESTLCEEEELSGYAANESEDHKRQQNVHVSVNPATGDPGKEVVQNVPDEETGSKQSSFVSNSVKDTSPEQPFLPCQAQPVSPVSSLSTNLLSASLGSTDFSTGSFGGSLYASEAINSEPKKPITCNTGNEMRYDDYDMDKLMDNLDVMRIAQQEKRDLSVEELEMIKSFVEEIPIISIEKIKKTLDGAARKRLISQEQANQFISNLGKVQQGAQVYFSLSTIKKEMRQVFMGK